MADNISKLHFLTVDCIFLNRAIDGQTLSMLQMSWQPKAVLLFTLHVNTHRERQSLLPKDLTIEMKVEEGHIAILQVEKNIIEI